jgi:hypothetical protein
MKAKKMAVIVTDALVGFIVILMGIAMTSFPLNIVWVLVNVWLWIVSPTVILWANKKENVKNSVC